MKLLHDTRVFLWWLDDPNRLAPAAQAAIRAAGADVFVSVASIWEIAIKRSSGRLAFPGDSRTYLDLNQCSPLPILAEHALATEALPFHHRGPFGHLLAAPALCRGCTSSPATRSSGSMPSR